MENLDLCIAMGMKSTKRGVWVRRVDPTNLIEIFLRMSDILLGCDGFDISNVGPIPFRCD
jgi:hypothetical protein